MTQIVYFLYIFFSQLFIFLFQMLQVIHTVEESSDTLAFATEPVMASLANILAYHVSILRTIFPYFLYKPKINIWITLLR